MEYLTCNGYDKVAKKLQKVTKLKNPDPKKTIWIYDYLMKNGYEKVAKKFAKAVLKPIKKPKVSLSDPDSLSFTLVLDYLNHQGYQIVAQELEKTVKCTKVDLNGLDLFTILESHLSKKSDPDVISYSLVMDYLNKHGYQSVTKELENELKLSKITLEKGLDLPSLINARKSQVSKPKLVSSTRWGKNPYFIRKFTY